MSAPHAPHSSSLDSKKNNRNTFCGRWSVKRQFPTPESPGALYARLNCKSWNCPRCGPKRVRQLRRAIIDRANEKNLKRFLTLTLDHKICSPEESARYIRSCWGKFRTYLKRKYGDSITFISILEPQKSGHAHLHILVDRYMDQRWLSSNWTAVGGGPMVNIKLVDIHRVSRYLSKYLTKELLLKGFEFKYRRYTTSRDIALFEKSMKGIWRVVQRSLPELWVKYNRRIADVGLSKDGEILSITLLEPG